MGKLITLKKNIYDLSQKSGSVAPVFLSGGGMSSAALSLVVAWKGEAFGYKNLGQAAKLIVRLLRPYSILGLMDEAFLASREKREEAKISEVMG
ncbi:MAG: hypothetical protein AB1589_02205 [Cyanobacteriota bacterium]